MAAVCGVLTVAAATGAATYFCRRPDSELAAQHRQAVRMLVGAALASVLSVFSVGGRVWRQVGAHCAPTRTWLAHTLGWTPFVIFMAAYVVLMDGGAMVSRRRWIFMFFVCCVLFVLIGVAPSAAIDTQNGTSGGCTIGHYLTLLFAELAFALVLCAREIRRRRRRRQGGTTSWQQSPLLLLGCALFGSGVLPLLAELGGATSELLKRDVPTIDQSTSAALAATLVAMFNGITLVLAFSVLRSASARHRRAPTSQTKSRRVHFTILNDDDAADSDAAEACDTSVSLTTKAVEHQPVNENNHDN